MVEKPKPGRPRGAKEDASPSGRVTHDEKGNAVWQWGQAREEPHGSLDHLGLSIEGAAPAIPAVQRRASAGAGYDPYQRDRAAPAPQGKRRDLRALSRHIELQRRVRQNKED